MVELRWLVRSGWDGSEKILQYRTQFDKTNYELSTVTGTKLVSKQWTPWQDVPTVDSTKSTDNT